MGLEQLHEQVASCRKCPRLVQWRETVAAGRKAEFRDWVYWGRGVPGWGDPEAKLIVMGLAPAAHGSNRTGRPFTGDRSGDWLYAAFHRAGLARIPTSTSREDGQELYGIWLSAAVKCAPPANRPTPDERDNCQVYLHSELELLPARTVLALGAFGWDATLRALAAKGHGWSGPKPKFGHEQAVRVGDYTVCGSFHPSPRNTQTGKLNEQMLDSAIAKAKRIAGIEET